MKHILLVGLSSLFILLPPGSSSGSKKSAFDSLLAALPERKPFLSFTAGPDGRAASLTFLNHTFRRLPDDTGGRRNAGGNPPSYR